MKRTQQRPKRHLRLQFQELEKRFCQAACVETDCYVDDSDAGFSAEGIWAPASDGESFQAGHLTSSPVDSFSIATWTFGNIQPGRYQVFASWPVNPHLAAFQVKYSIVDGSTSIGTFVTSQRSHTTSANSANTNWQQITGPITLFNSVLKVTVTNQAQGVVVADAIRLTRLSEAPAQPVFKAIRNEHYNITESRFDFRDSPFVEPVFLGSPVTQEIRIRNEGSGVLTLGNPVLPDGYTLTEEFSSTELSAGEVATFKITLNATEVGIFNSHVIILTNDPTSPTQRLLVRGVVTQLPEDSIRIDEIGDVERRREALVDLIWSGQGAPNRMPDEVQEDIESPINNLPNLSSVDRLRVDMTDEFTSFVYQYNPILSNNHLSIYHRGHGDLPADTSTIAFYLSLGFTVIDVRMPLFYPNFGPVASHNDMQQFKSDTVDPIKYFVEPLVVSLNYLQDTHNLNDRIVMTGLSGGGWTTTLYAALNPDISLSFPVAGSLPRYAQAATEGDFEQYYQPLLDAANYLEMYVLASTGPGRAQFQVLNEFDPCCFYGNRHTGYEHAVKSTIDALGSGHFDVISDDTHTQHTISDFVIEHVFNVELQSRSFPLVADSDLIIKGTADSDRITIEAGLNTIISINGHQMELPASAFNSIIVDAGDGFDEITILGTAGDDTIFANDDRVSFSSTAVRLSILNAEQLHIDGNGGSDFANIETSDENASVTARALAVTQFLGPQIISIENLPQITIEKPLGGVGTVSIFDSTAHDTVEISPGHASITGSNFRIEALGYSFISANAFGGGNDEVTIHDSPGNDHFHGAPRNAELIGDDYSVHVNGFRYIRAHSVAGGVDSAFFEDSTADDIWGSTPDFAHIYDKIVSYYTFASGFNNVHAFSFNGGTDTANLYDSPNDDIAIIGPRFASLTSLSSAQHVNGFSSIHAYANLGLDSVTLLDSPGHDDFTLRPRYGHLSSLNFQYEAIGFGRISAISTNGGFDSVSFHDSPGDDLFLARPRNVSLTGNHFSNAAIGFRYARAYSTAGGFDSAELYDSILDDNFGSTPDFAHIYDNAVSYYNYARGFENVTGYSVAGGNDLANLYDSRGDDVLIGQPGDTTLSGDSFRTRAIGFTRLNAFASLGFDRISTFVPINTSTLEMNDGSLALSSSRFTLTASTFDDGFVRLAPGGSNSVDILDNLGGGQLTAHERLLRYNFVGWQIRVAYPSSVRAVSHQESFYAVDEFHGTLSLEGQWTPN